MNAFLNRPALRNESTEAIVSSYLVAVGWQFNWLKSLVEIEIFQSLMVERCSLNLLIAAGDGDDALLLLLLLILFVILNNTFALIF